MQSRRFFGFLFLLLLTSTQLFSITDQKLRTYLKSIGDNDEEVAIDGETLTFDQAMLLSGALTAANSNFSAFSFTNMASTSEGTVLVISGVLKNPNISTLDLSGSFLDEDAMEEISSIIKGGPTSFAISGITELKLSGAQSKEENWLKFIKALKINKHQRSVDLCGIKDESNNTVTNDLFTIELEKSFSQAKNLALDLSDCGFVDEDKITRLKENSLRSVTLTYKVKKPQTDAVLEGWNAVALVDQPVGSKSLYVLMYELASQLISPK